MIKYNMKFLVGHQISSTGFCYGVFGANERTIYQPFFFGFLLIN